MGASARVVGGWWDQTCSVVTTPFDDNSTSFADDLLAAASASAPGPQGRLGDKALASPEADEGVGASVRTTILSARF